jgi:glycosyltransferase involved in cell wall biosynthesis
MRQFASEVQIGCRLHCVWNCPTLEEAANASSPSPGETLRILYHGSINPLRLPLAMLDALASLEGNVRLRIIGYETTGHQGYVTQFLDRATQLGIRGRVQFLHAVPRFRLFDLCKDCDVGIAFMPTRTEDTNMRCMIGASNKAFDYLACGLALLVTDLPDWRDTFVASGYGLSCDPEDMWSIANALRWLQEYPEERKGMGKRGRQRILTDWNYEKQFEPVFRVMQRT